ncbi:MAG: response regulator [Deltaproteobacteria bacterium]|nr:response regulator [Deltaproteobacteria bacterium]
MMNRTLLLVDDEQNVLGALKRQLRRERYKILEACSGPQALRLLEEQEIGVVLSDLTMPGMDGITLLGEVKTRFPDTVRILLTGNGTLENAMEAINGLQVFAFLSKPWSREGLKGILARAFEHYNLIKENRRLLKLTQDQNQELMRFNRDLERLVRERTQQMDQAVREGIRMLAIAAEAKDDDTGEHVKRIQEMTLDICRNLGLSDEESDRISFFSTVHDIGKIHVPDAILKKPGPLDPEEWAVMKAHTLVGSRILGVHPFYRTAREIARSHHERWDGTGYPDGLRGHDIPLPARIVAVADVYDALTHSRPYKVAWPVEKALEEMKAQSGKAFDPEILEAFLHVISEEGLFNKTGRKNHACP